ncbi:MAG: excinuclease ABC subunit UvrC [Candidatus Caenarcaniphilales bacterium]|nr:excinuclease ABC subunit UvrC [Candidatus Caenarcaniphilales bacterium]
MVIDLQNITNRPGVYLFKNFENKTIYIGKAINLRSRVRSYFNKNTWKDRPKLSILVPQIETIETIITQNEKEALILEANLVYEHQPKYNVLLKDNNRSFPWIALTYGEPFPRILPIRDVKWVKRKYPKAKLFGPYTDIGAMYKTLKTAKELFPLRKRAKPLHRDRPCLNYHIGQCLGPCQQLVTEDEYDLLLKQVELFLNGKHNDLLGQLKKRMEDASENLQYENAAKYRDQIKVILRTLEEQRVITDDPNCNRDIIGFALSETDICVQIFKMREGRLVGRESYFAELNEVQTLGESLEAVLKQAYVIRQSEDVPQEFLVQNEIDGFSQEISSYWLEEKSFADEFEEFLSSITEKRVKLLFPQKGEKKEQIELASYNALQELSNQEKQKAKQLLMLESLQEALELIETPQKIDCFDISHLQGTEVVASCVRLRGAQPDKSKYRKIKLKTDQNNDFESMYEAVFRRYNKSSARKEVDLPNLIVIDGGKGQLSFAVKALKDLEVLEDVEIVSLAKKEEEIYCVDGQKIQLPKNSPALKVVQKARDEAHRFALTYNRQRRQKSMKQSLIDAIPGVGRITKEKIKKVFTVKQLFKAAPQELDSKLGIGSKRADRLWQAIQKINT